MAKISFPTARILWIVSILLIFVVGGTIVFIHTEHLGVLDALYLTAQTLSTVGYGDMAPETKEGKILSVILMAAGASVALTAAGVLVGFIVEGRLLRHFGARRMTRQIEKLKNHIILCGYGAMGHRVAANLIASGSPFVIIERRGSAAEEAREAGMLVLEGEATQEEVLRQAGLTRARGLLTAIGDDAENLYIGMTAKMICPKLPIICRVLSDKAVRHLKRAGIDQVISPEEMGAGRMVQQLLRPEVVDFLDLMLSPGSTSSGLEAYQILEGCKLVGKELKDSGIREKFGLFVIAMRREGKYIPNPASNEVIQDRDVLILVGTEDAFVRFRDALAAASQ